MLGPIKLLITRYDYIQKNCSLCPLMVLKCKTGKIVVSFEYTTSYLIIRFNNPSWFQLLLQQLYVHDNFSRVFFIQMCKSSFTKLVYKILVPFSLIHPQFFCIYSLYYSPFFLVTSLLYRNVPNSATPIIIQLSNISISFLLLRILHIVCT